MSGLDRNTYYGKISKTVKEFDKLDLNQVRDGIDNTSGINKLRLKEPIEYVVELEEVMQKNKLNINGGLL